MGEIYTSLQYEKNYPDGLQYSYWNQARNRIILDKLKALDVAQERILDIGAGRGIAVDFLRARGLDVFGVELGNPGPLNESISKYLYLNQDVAALPEAFRDTVTVVTLLDVLEHIEDPNAFLSVCARSFRNLKTVLITLPASMKLWSNYDEFFGHYKRYDRETASELSIGPDFKQVSKGYFFHLLYLPIRLLSVLKVPRSLEMKAPENRLGVLLNLVLGVLFWLDGKLLPKRLIGSSVYVALKRT